jgi:hypothetical protein
MVIKIIEKYNYTTIILTMFNSSGPLIDIKLIPASFATALANSVFPQPGGPHNNTPVGTSKPNALNSLA